jgi:putative effector of murein hydrolase
MSATIASIAATIAIYVAARWLNAWLPWSITNPVVTATACIMAALALGGIDYASFESGARYLSELLSPAVIALAVPLFKHRAVLRSYALSACMGICAGGFAALSASVLLAQLLGLADVLVPALGIKSATAPIAVQLGPIVRADAGLCAVFAIATGMLGAVLGPFLLNALRIVDPVARGLAFGSIAHGIGTSQAAAEGELQGAVSGVAMGCSAVLVSLAAPLLLPHFM